MPPTMIPHISPDNNDLKIARIISCVVESVTPTLIINSRLNRIVVIRKDFDFKNSIIFPLLFHKYTIYCSIHLYPNCQLARYIKHPCFELACLAEAIVMTMPLWRASSRISKRKDSILIVSEIWMRHKGGLKITFDFTTNIGHNES